MMDFIFSYFSIRKVVRKALSLSKAGNQLESLQVFDTVLNNKELLRPSIWKMTWSVAEKIFRNIGDQRLANLCLSIFGKTAKSDDYYSFGYALVERGLDNMALTVLNRGAQLFPNDEKILTELAYVYGELELFDQAKHTLLNSPYLIVSMFMPRYLLVFNSLMMGDLREATRWFRGLEELLSNSSLDLRENYTYMFNTIASMIERAKVVVQYTSLDAFDLRGWNAVVNGNLVLHLSEFDKETMGGRYGYIQEGPEKFFGCLHQLIAVLKSLSIVPSRILALPDEDSLILAYIAARFFHCSVEIFSEETRDLSGLIICYHSDAISPETLILLSKASECQIFWCHAFNWTQQSLAPDFISYFAQYATPPWKERISLAFEENDKMGRPQIVTKQLIRGSFEEIAERVYELVDVEEIENPPEVTTLAHLLFSYLETKSKTIFEKQRDRLRHWKESPVKSATF
ncbi:MAG: hypothetical protein Tsb0021_02990 [Chlamydiales bacterium]